MNFVTPFIQPMPPITDRFLNALEFTLRWEGGFSTHPDDPGGATNFGVTQRVYDAFRKKNSLRLQSVKQIDRKEVLSIYQSDYWLVVDCEKIAPPMDFVHFDTCVNFGPFQAAKFLQQALSVLPDGYIGQITLLTLSKSDPRLVAGIVCDERIKFRHERVRQNASQEKFLQGWLNRDNALKKLATELLD